MLSIKARRYDFPKFVERPEPIEYWYRRAGTDDPWTKGKKATWLRGEYDIRSRMTEDDQIVEDLFKDESVSSEEEGLLSVYVFEE